MDEPLSNLDAKLRAQTRSEIRRLQHEVGTTTVYVTHDQVEAMTMGDRIATMRDGVLEQVGDPDSVYEQPANTFVASFIGSPAMSLARVGAERRNGDVAARCSASSGSRSTARVDVPAEVIVGVRAGAHAPLGRGGRAARAARGARRVRRVARPRDGEVQLLLGEQQQLVLDGAVDVPAEVILGARPEHTRLWESEGNLLGPIDGTVEYVESLGRETLIGVEAAGAARFVVEADGRVRAEPGEAVRFGLRRGWVYLFDAENRAGTRADLGRLRGGPGTRNGNANGWNQRTFRYRKERALRVELCLPQSLISRALDGASMPLGLGRRPGTQGQSNHPTRFKTILRKRILPNPGASARPETDRRLCAYKQGRDWRNDGLQKKSPPG